MSDSTGGPSSQPAFIEEKRCLSAVLEWGFALGVFAPQHVFRWVPPRDLMRSFAHRPEIRTEVLRAASLSTRPGESAAALGDRVLLAIECGEADGDAILASLPLDDCAWMIPHLIPLPAVWQLVAGATPTDAEPGRAFLGFVVERFLDFGLLSAADIVAFPGFRGRAAVSLDELLEALDRDELIGLTRCLLHGDPAEVILERVLPSRIAEIAPVKCLWDDFLRPRLHAAARHAKPGPTLTYEFAELSFDEEESVTVAKRSSPPAELGPESAPGSGGTAGDFSEREGIVAALASVGRLPPHHSMLPLAILRGLEQLYWAMLAAESVAQRAEAFRTTFPNDADLRVALVAMQPIFFPEDEVDALAATDDLIRAIERADREINAREIESGISPRLPSDPNITVEQSSTATPLARVPLKSMMQARVDASKVG